MRLLTLLARDELGVGELVRILQTPQSTVSRQLKLLQQAGWVRRRADGNAAWYRADLDAVGEAARALWQVVGADHTSSLLAAEDNQRLDQILAERRPDAETFFGREHARWDTLRTELFGDRFLLPTLLSLLPSDLTVVDVGCGTGEVLAALAPVVARVIGVDREAAMLDAARRRTDGLPHVSLRQGALEHLPLADAEVHCATCILVLHHAVDPTRALTELRRVARDRVVLLDMVAHDREDWQHTMGHRQLGFSAERITDDAAAAGLIVRSRVVLPTQPGVQGPPLFVSVLEPAA